MSSAKLVVKNTSLLLFTSVLGRILSFVLIIFIANYLGDVGLGKYSFAFAFAGMISVFSDFGITTSMIKDIAKSKVGIKNYFSNVISMKLLFSLLTLGGSCIAIILVAKATDVIFSVFLVAIALFFDNITLAVKSIFTAYERLEYFSFVELMERIIAALLGVLVLWRGYGLIPLIFVFVLSYLTSFILSLFLVIKKFTRFTLKFDFKLWKRLFRKSLPFWFTTLFMSIYFRVDTIMLAAMKGYAVVGWYNAAYKIIDAISFIPFVVIAAIFPTMSKFHVTSRNLLEVLYQKAFYYLFLLAVPIGIGVTLLADRFILFVYKQQFTNSALALQILVWALVFMFVNYLMGYLLNSINKQKLFTYSAGICVLVNIIINLILIPLYSYAGAAIATVATEFVNFGLLLYFTFRSKYFLNFFKLLKPVAAGILMGLFVLSISRFHIFYIVPLAAGVYFAVLLIIKGIGKEEFDLARSFIGKAKQP
jgi:O-antigen/teichoic acid export membrane protein